MMTSTRFPSPLRKAITATLLSCSLITIAVSTAQAAEIEMSFQNLLQQERTWAGLQTKTLKVGDITWSYSEGGQAGKPIVILIQSDRSSTYRRSFTWRLNCNAVRRSISI